MSKVQMVRALVNQRLTAAAEEIFGLFERTIAEYEEELCRSKEKNRRQQKLLDAVLKPEVRLHRADIQQLVVKEEVPPEQQEWSPSLDQEDPPEPPHIKEEQEELWTSQEGEQLQGLEEADITKFLFTLVPVKSEDDEEKNQSSQLHQRQTEEMETGADGEDCGGPEPARNSHPDTHLQPETEDDEDWNDTTAHESSVNLGKKPFSCSTFASIQAESHKCVGPQSSQLHQQDKIENSSDTGDSDDWSKDIRGPPSGSKSLKNNDVSKNVARCKTNEYPLSCSLSAKASKGKRNLRQHMAVHTGEKLFRCSICEKRFKRKGEMKVHMAVHSADKPFKCSFCEKGFTQKGNLTGHMAIHTGEKTFCCTVCDQRFIQKGHLKLHMAKHTGDKPFKCSVCEKAFTQNGHLTQHMFLHSAEKTFKCSVCGTGFTQKAGLTLHMAVHKAEKLFSCCFCEKSFKRKRDMKEHMAVHTGEKPFKCSVCEKAFTQKGTLRQHMPVHTGEKKFSCSVCDQRFTWRHQLAKHKRVCPQSSQLHQTEQNREAEPGASSSTEQMETGPDGEDCGGPEPARNSHPEDETNSL